MDEIEENTVIATIESATKKHARLVIEKKENGYNLFKNFYFFKISIKYI